MISNSKIEMMNNNLKVKNTDRTYLFLNLYCL